MLARVVQYLLVLYLCWPSLTYWKYVYGSNGVKKHNISPDSDMTEIIAIDLHLEFNLKFCLL